jgi:hypothetical protein
LKLKPFGIQSDWKPKPVGTQSDLKLKPFGIQSDRKPKPFRTQSDWKREPFGIQFDLKPKPFGTQADGKYKRFGTQFTSHDWTLSIPISPLSRLFDPGSLGRSTDFAVFWQWENRTTNFLRVPCINKSSFREKLQKNVCDGISDCLVKKIL